jgi:hypothetical protein
MFLPSSVFLLAVLAAAFSRDRDASQRSVTTTSIDRAAATQRPSPQPWDEPRVVTQVLAVLANFATTKPDVHAALDLVNLVCSSADAPELPSTRADDWEWWHVPVIPGHRIKVSFGRGREAGIEMSRVLISVMPSVPLPDPFRAWGSLIDVKTSMQGDKPEIIGVVTYATDFRHDAKTCRGMEDDTPPVMVGHRFRVDSTGGIKLINYTAELLHEPGHYVIQYNFGSLATEYDSAAPSSELRMEAADTLAAIERRTPAGG